MRVLIAPICVDIVPLRVLRALSMIEPARGALTLERYLVRLCRKAPKPMFAAQTDRHVANLSEEAQGRLRSMEEIPNDRFPREAR